MAKRIGFWLGLLLLIAGAAAGLTELVTLMRGAHRTISIGSIWFSIHANSLVGFQALIEKRIAPALWPPIQYLLTLSAWLVLLPPGLLLTLFCRPTREILQT
ncbi:MAG: hypothetical protein ACREH6_04640 [Geminicoccaceae bacterium]